MTNTDTYKFYFNCFSLAPQEWARLHEQGMAPRILYISPDRRVDEGTAVKLTAQVQGTPAPKVVW